MTKDLLKKAVVYATKAHKGQYRKGGNQVPYITHPIAVGNILRDRGYNVEVRISAILHDVVEDCDGYSLDDISNEFGKSVATIVDYVSESDKSLPWKERKIDYIKRLEEGPFEAVVVSAADKLHNLRCTKEALDEVGKSTFSMFNSSADHQFWFYESLIEIYKSELLFSFTDEMEDLLREIKKVFV
jgi:(p)ppGpp synthase/HD superfamily hydrolase